MLIELCGWQGAACILSTYLYLTQKQTNPSRRIHIVNLVGCGLLIINVWTHSAWPSVGINLVWSVIALLGIYKERPLQPVQAILCGHPGCGKPADSHFLVVQADGTTIDLEHRHGRWENVHGVGMVRLTD